MLKKVLADACKGAIAPNRVRLGFEQLASANPEAANITPEHARVLAAIFSASQALGNQLVARPSLAAYLSPEKLRHPRHEQGLRKEAEALRPLLEAKNYPEALAWLREFKQREMLRIAARDLIRVTNVAEITREISDVADICLSAVWQVCRDQFVERYGRPWHQDSSGKWQPTAFCVLGMGKLGGQELNYSSDVDVLFVYSEEGQVFKETPGGSKVPRAIMASHAYFNRLAEAFIAEVSRMAPEGMLYRIDLRLRPEGDAGPLCRSLDSYETYYAQWGQTWERMMLIKARRVAGNEGLAAEFLEMIHPFRYPRAVSESVLQEIGAMKERIEHEVLRTGELERNVKLGRGGIREIEFIVQSQQLLQAGRQPFLQGSQTLPALDKLAQYRLLPEGESRALRAAYEFLRDVEHRLQMENLLQTHTIPEDRAMRERLARLMGFRSAKEFETARRRHTDAVRKIFDDLIKSGPPPTGMPFPREFAGAEADWKHLLEEHSFRDPDKAFHVLREFVEGPGYVHVSPRTIELAHNLLRKLFALCPKQNAPTQGKAWRKPADSAATGKREPPILSDPDRVLTRLDSFIAAYGARAVLFESWNNNPAIFELLLLLFDRSEFLAELAIHTPDLVDDLVTSGRLRQRKTAEEVLKDLRHGLDDADQRLWLRRYHQAELMRIGLRDILGLADLEQYREELSALADACLRYALEATMRKHRFKTAPFAIIGLGKLGGAEIDYGSDLDIIFVADSKAKQFQKLQSVALEVMELLSRRTESGIVFHTDARLRPDGGKGLLVNTLAAYEAYYRERAQLWEIQSLTRTRPVAGDLKVGAKFQELARALTDFSRAKEAGAKHNVLPACFSADWKSQIDRMRKRIEKERTPAGKDDLAIKTGKGGLMDAEFIAQMCSLEHGWLEANTMKGLERARDEKALPDAEKLIHNYRELRRVEGILRRWSYEGETVLPDDPAPFYRVSIRCGFKTPDAFREALAQWRRAIREVYRRVFE